MSEFSENEWEGEVDPSEDEEKKPFLDGGEEATNEAPVKEDGERVVYRWNYDEQLRHDEELQKKQRRRGIILFASVMSAVFFLCIALLLGVIAWSSARESNWGSHDLSDIGTVAETVSPCVVLIEGTSGLGTNYGTGFFLTENGHIATNYHVIRSAKSIRVILYSGKSYSAEVVGYYAPDDLAVIKIDGMGYPVLQIGNSNALRVGDTVVAVGNPSGAEAAWTTTHGIISSTARRVLVSSDDFTGSLKMIQTDAPINPGNSGGPLCNLRGEVVGVITQKLSGYEGLGFAIPINEAMHTLEAIMEGKTDSFTSTASRERPSIGIMAENITEGKTYTVDNETYTAPYSGVLISEIVAGSGADGVLLYGDLLYEFDGKAVQNMQVLQNLLFQKKIGDIVKLKVWRTDMSVEVTVKLS